MTYEEAAMLEPFSVGVYACERGQVTAGHAVLITGAGPHFSFYDCPACLTLPPPGPIGLACLIAARAFGATKLLIAGTSRLRRVPPIVSPR